MKKKITKAQADAQAKRDKFLELAKTCTFNDNMARQWRTAARRSRREMDLAHRDFLAVEAHLK